MRYIRRSGVHTEKWEEWGIHGGVGYTRRSGVHTEEWDTRRSGYTWRSWVHTEEWDTHRVRYTRRGIHGVGNEVHTEWDTYTEWKMGCIWRETYGEKSEIYTRF